MGLYDSIYFSCPNCNSSLEVQTKAGACHLSTYDARDLPANIAKNIQGGRVWCKHCNVSWQVQISSIKRLEARLTDKATYFCTVCHTNPVQPENGEDTCWNCIHNV